MRPYKIKYATNSDRDVWDEYVRKHPHVGPFHMFGWREVIHRTYGHATYYLMVVRAEADGARTSVDGARHFEEKILGVLPLVHLKHILFGNYLISMPFLDGGGILASCRGAEEWLLSEAIRIGQEVGAARIELRHEQPLFCWDDIEALGFKSSGTPLRTATRSHKVRMLLTLPESSEMLMKSFDAKLRSQIKKPLREGLTFRVGGIELIEDFYRVFLVNMRDLGSPIHSVELMRQVLRVFSEESRIFVVYLGKEPVAASLVIGFNKALHNPWAASLRKYGALSPNMLLYFRMLEYACDRGYQIFDFGRCSPGEGTYRFKEQWGAKPAPLCWHYISLDGTRLDLESSEKGRFEKAIRYWKMLPLPVTRIVGPSIRKHIGL